MERKIVQPSSSYLKKATNLQLLLQDENRDRLSSLPDSLLVSILSLLPLQIAIRTSVLSHRWHYVWTQITHLDLSYFYRPRRYWNNDEVLSDIFSIDHIFEQLTSNKIHTLHLKCPNLVSNDNQVRLCRQSALEKWLGRFCALNVEDLKVISTGYHTEESLLDLPTCTFQCHSLAVLEIDCGFRFKLPDDGIISLPNLNKLLLRDLADWDCETMSTLFKSCPVLEVLDVSVEGEKHGQCIIDISCQNLRTLKIEPKAVRSGWNYAPEVQTGWSYKINAPKLEVFDVFGVVSSFQFVENPCLLTNAKINFSKFEDVGVDYIATMSGLLQRICSVKSLQLNDILLYPLIHYNALNLPSFHSLSELRICWNDTSLCKNVLCCLHCAPNLKALFIYSLFRVRGAKWEVPDCVPLCLPQKIKRIEVTQLEGSEEELKLLKYIIGNANVLKSILVGVSSNSTSELGKEEDFCKNLFLFPRGSRACEINFQGLFRALSKNNDDEILVQRLVT